MRFVLAAILVNLAALLDRLASSLTLGQHLEIFPGDLDDITRALLRAADPQPPETPAGPSLPGPDVLEQVADLLAELSLTS